MKNLKFKKPIAIFLALALIIPTLAITVGGFSKSNDTTNKDAIKLSADDTRVAEEISNNTGVAVEKVVDMKKDGMSWNDILQKLKNSKNIDFKAENDKRSELLAKSGLYGEYFDKIKKESFEDQDILDAKMIVDRAMYQLQEISAGKVETSPNSYVNPDLKSNDESAAYADLLGKIDSNKAVYLLLKLKKDFVTYEKAFDEYLLSLQLGIDLEKYLQDKAAYEKDKSEKSKSFDMQKIITLVKIEEQMLKKVKEQNIKNDNNLNIQNDSISSAGNKQGQQNSNADTPALQLPEVNNTKPKDPRADVMKEINDIRNKSLN